MCLTSRATMLVFLPLALVLVVVEASILDPGFGYQATTDVSAILNLALDLKEMRLARDDIDRKRMVYEQGTQGFVSLQTLSLDAETAYGGTPMYTFYKAGFALLGAEEEGDDPFEFDGMPVERYADTIVGDLFSRQVVHLEAEGALSLNVAMAFWSSLWNVLQSCQTNDVAAMNASLDEAAAYWVGAEQVKGDSSTGFFFYNLAQFVGSKFNQDAGDSEVLLNQEVLASLVLVQEEVNQGVCADSAGYRLVRDEVRRLTGHLNRALVQMLIHRVETITGSPGQDTDFVQLYSLALLPQVSSCNPDAYYKLVELTVKSNVTPETQQEVIETLQSIYSCLHVTCRDVGAYEESLVPECNDNPEPRMPIVGYQPTTDVRRFLAMDRDIRQIRWLMSFGAFQAAQDFYEYGWNGIIPFGNIAKNNFLAEVDTTPDFTAIENYYGDERGATFHDILTGIFVGTAPFDVSSTAQRASTVDGFLKGPLIYLAVMGVIEEAIVDCVRLNMEGQQRRWEEAFAFYVGSTEGPNVGGTETFPGESLWGIGDRYCEYFSDCIPGDAQVNERILQSFQSSWSVLESGQCELIFVNEYHQNIRTNLLVGMIQGTLFHYIQWSLGDAEDSGYIYAFSRFLAPVFFGVLSGSGETDLSVVQDFARLTDFTLDPFQPDAVDVENLFGYVTSLLAEFPLNCQYIGAVRVDNSGLLRQVCPGDIIIDPPPVPAPPTFAPTWSPTLFDAALSLSPTQSNPFPSGTPSLNCTIDCGSNGACRNGTPHPGSEAFGYWFDPSAELDYQSCECTTGGYGGKFCDQEGEDCNAFTCLNGGSCYDVNGEPMVDRCNCLNADETTDTGTTVYFDGRFCQYPSTAICEETADDEVYFCTNFGQCNLDPTTRNLPCDCPDGFVGFSCEYLFGTDCSLDCGDNGICRLGVPPSGSPEYTHWVDQTGPGSHQYCECEPFWGGQFCDTTTSLPTDQPTDAPTSSTMPSSSSTPTSFPSNVTMYIPSASPTGNLTLFPTNLPSKTDPPSPGPTIPPTTSVNTTVATSAAPQETGAVASRSILATYFSTTFCFLVFLWWWL